MLIAVVLIFFLTKIEHSGVLIAIIAISVYLYAGLHDLLPDKYQYLYHWMEQNIRQEVNLTFMSSIPWVSIGYFVSSRKMETLSLGRVWNYVVLAALLIIGLLFHSYEAHLFRPIVVIAIVIAFFHLDLKPRKVYKVMRNMSILIFFLHFTILKILWHTGYPMLKGGLLTFCTALIISIAFSYLIIIISNKQYFISKILRLSY